MDFYIEGQVLLEQINDLSDSKVVGKDDGLKDLLILSFLLRLDREGSN